MSYRQTIGAFAIAKFALGAWLIVIVIPILVGLMLFVGRQYARRRAETAVRPELVVGPPRRRQRVLIPASDVTRDVVKAVKFGRTMSDDVSAIHVTDDLDRAAAVRERFARQLPGLPLIVLESPFRSLVRPLIRYLDDIAGAAADDVIVFCCRSICRATGGSGSSTTTTPIGSSSRSSAGRTSSSPPSRSAAMSRAERTPTRHAGAGGGRP